MKCLECETKMELVPKRKDDKKLTTLYHECPECGSIHDSDYTITRD